MRRHTGTALALVALALAGACATSDAREEASVGTGPPRTATTSASTSATTTAPVPAFTNVGPSGPGALVTTSGVVLPVASRAGDRFTVTTPCGRAAAVTGGTFVPAATVVLDPGHGGSERGAVAASGLAEATVNLAVAQYAKAALEAAGVTTILTRTADYDMSLAPRTQVATAVGARAFVSIHHNADPDGPSPRPGSETYYQIGSADSKRLAGLVYEEVVRALTPYQVAWVADTDAGAKYRPGTSGDYYAVLRLAPSVVSVLSELAFISNPPEAALLARPDVQKVEGEALARGIVRYLTSKDPGSGFTTPYPRLSPPAVPGPPVVCTDPAM